MKRIRFLVGTLLVVVAAASGVRGDGGFFVTITEAPAGDLAQTRQEALLAIHDDGPDGEQRVTYVLRTHYDGNPSEFAWVIPVPATPTDVTAVELLVTVSPEMEQIVIRGSSLPGDAVKLDPMPLRPLDIRTLDIERLDTNGFLDVATDFAFDWDTDGKTRLRRIAQDHHNSRLQGRSWKKRHLFRDRH